MSTTWAEQPLEQLLRSRLNILPGSQGDDLYGDYTSARKGVLEDIVEHIGTVEPNLTDHGNRHLADVMGRALQLLELGQHDLSPRELYILCVSILFHDVGNLHGRADHQKKIGQIYRHIRGEDTRFLGERNAVLAVAGAHTGSTMDGSKDTLNPLGSLPFLGQPIRLRQIAAILRLADELAEGTHRTSAYLKNIGAYSVESLVYHAYARVSEYTVQAGPQGRIAMTFTLDVTAKNGVLEVHGVKLSSLLELCYRRIVKLDQERKFCKYYCSYLSDLAETNAWFNFYFDGQQLPLDLHPIVISDLTVPGDKAKTVPEHDTDYEVARLVTSLNRYCNGGGA